MPSPTEVADGGVPRFAPKANRSDTVGSAAGAAGGVARGSAAIDMPESWSKILGERSDGVQGPSG